MASYTINNVQTNHAGSYTVVITNSAGAVTSAVATLTVNAPPMITMQPQSTNVAAGSMVTFFVQATGTAPLRYQWRQNGTNITAATNSAYTLSNVQQTHAGDYTVVVTNRFGAVTSAVATLIIHNLPTITSQPESRSVLVGSSVALSVTATDAMYYQWRRNGANIPNATNALYTINNVQTSHAGTYSVIVSNLYGFVTSADATLTVITGPAVSSVMVVAWGESNVWNGVTNVDVTPPKGLSNVVAIAAGRLHSLALRGDGLVIGWGDNTYGQASPPSGLSDGVAIAAGGYHSLALRGNSTVVAWGQTNAQQINVPAGLSNVTAIAAGGFHSLALRRNGTVVGWGSNTNGQSSPVATTNVMAIAAGWEHSLAVLSNSTVVGWGANNFGQRRIPSGLSNVIAVAAGDYHSLALKNDGTVVAWGLNDHGQTNVPPPLSNVVAIAAGANHCLALKRSGTVEGWGQDNFFQTEPPTDLMGVFAIAAGGDRSLALKRKLLKLLAPEHLASGHVRLRIANTDGSPVEADRLSTVQIHSTTNLALNVSLWTKLTNSISLVDGVLESEDPENLPWRFYITVD
jgi:alpha-tubulin suppressor-like RCC1 family protein